MVAMEIGEIIRLIESDPTKRAQLRAVILTDELLEQPERIARIDEHVAQMDLRLTTRMDKLAERMDQLTERMDQLTERMDQLTERMDQLTERMDKLADRMDQLADRMDQLADRMDQMSERMDQMGTRMDQLISVVEHHEKRLDNIDGKLGNLEGWRFEEQINRNPRRYLNVLIRGCRPCSVQDKDLIDDKLTAIGTDLDEIMKVLSADSICTTSLDGVSVYVVVQASLRVHIDDLERAMEEAMILSRLGIPVVPVALSMKEPGDVITSSARTLGVGLAVANPPSALVEARPIAA